MCVWNSLVLAGGVWMHDSGCEVPPTLTHSIFPARSYRIARLSLLHKLFRRCLDSSVSVQLRAWQIVWAPRQGTRWPHKGARQMMCRFQSCEWRSTVPLLCPVLLNRDRSFPEAACVLLLQVICKITVRKFWWQTNSFLLQVLAFLLGNSSMEGKSPRTLKVSIQSNL